MRFNRLTDWLSWQETLNPVEIDLGLDRVQQVLLNAGYSSRFNCPLITVAGTNGKGSVVALLESLALSCGLSVGSYTSPHLFKYNERIKINAQPVSDEALCMAFDNIDQARTYNRDGAKLPEEIALTYFEFGTLAAIDIFARQELDLIILEVGLGGRLDAVNVMDADVGIVTSVAIDHIDWLGDDREKIGREKAGIFRQQQPVVYGERSAPKSLLAHAKALQCSLVQLGEHYEVQNLSEGDWCLKSPHGDITPIVSPALIGDFQKANAATAIVAMQILLADNKINVMAFDEAVNTAMKEVQLAGRFQQLADQPAVYVDVAHNPHSAAALSTQLRATREEGSKTWAILAMLSDKDITGVLDKVDAEIDQWCFAGLDNVARGLSWESLFDLVCSSFLGIPLEEVDKQKLRQEITKNQCTILPDSLNDSEIMLVDTVATACAIVAAKATAKDRIIIFGSFYTVAEAMAFFTKSLTETVQTDTVEQ